MTLEDDTEAQEGSQMPKKSSRQLLIHNYGLFWKAADVWWGRKKNAGHLFGRAMPQGRIRSPNDFDSESDKVDFRSQRGVYVLYDDTFSLLYVGKAGAGKDNRLFDRLKAHTVDPLANRWTMFSWFGVLRVNKTTNKLQLDKDAVHPTVPNVLSQIEAILITASEPPLNRRGGDFLGAERFEQIRDNQETRLGRTTDEMIRDIWEKI